MKFAQVLVCVAAVSLLWSCASSSNSPQSGNSSNYPGRNPNAHERDQRYLTTAMLIDLPTRRNSRNHRLNDG